MIYHKEHSICCKKKSEPLLSYLTKATKRKVKSLIKHYSTLGKDPIKPNDNYAFSFNFIIDLTDGLGKTRELEEITYFK